MAITNDISNDIGKLRMLLNDQLGVDFSDEALTGLLTRANESIPLDAAASDSVIYWAAHMGWLIKAGITADNALRNKIANVVMTDTFVTHRATMQIVTAYRDLALGSTDVEVQVPRLDLITPILASTRDPAVYPNQIAAREAFEEIA